MIGSGLLASRAMTSRSRPPAEGSPRGRGPGSGGPGAGDAPARTSAADDPAGSGTAWDGLSDDRPGPLLLAALGGGSVAAVLLAVGAVAGVSPDASPGFTSWPLLALLALAPVLAAVGCALAGRPGPAAGILLGLAALAPGRLLLDLQFAVNGPLTVRPELYLPDRFVNGSAVGAGFWLLMAGHVLTAVAGLLAWRAVRARAAAIGDEPEGRRWRLLLPLLAVAAAVGLLAEPVQSDNGFLAARAAFEGPWPALGGYLLLAAALPLAAALALVAPSEGAARGALYGLGAAAAGLVLPPLVAGFVRDDMHPTWGPMVVLIAMVFVAVLASTSLTAAVPGDAARGDLAGEARLPSLFWWRLTAAVLALATAAAAVIGALAPQVVVTSVTPGAEIVTASSVSPARWFLLAAGVLVAVLALAMLVPAAAAAVRPVLSVGWAGVVLAGTAVISTALTATQAGNLTAFGGANMSGLLTSVVPNSATTFIYDLGSGAIWTCVALVLAALASLAAVVTGVVERDDTGAEGPRPNGSVLTPVVAAGVLAVAAFGLPVFSAPGYTAAGLWSNFDTPSWGLLTALVIVLGAAALALRSRPRPAAALLVGAALLAGLHAAELPLVGGSVAGAQAATGFWVALASAVAFLVAAVMAIAGARRDA